MKNKPEVPEPPKPDRVAKDNVTISWRPVKSEGKRDFKGYQIEKRLKDGDWELVTPEPIKKNVLNIPKPALEVFRRAW